MKADALDAALAGKQKRNHFRAEWPSGMIAKRYQPLARYQVHEKAGQRLSLQGGSSRTAGTRVLRLLSVTCRAVRPVAVRTYASHAVRSAFAGLAALQPAQLCAVHFVHQI